jgi:hypothetical protein
MLSILLVSFARDLGEPLDEVLSAVLVIVAEAAHEFRLVGGGIALAKAGLKIVSPPTSRWMVNRIFYANALRIIIEEIVSGLASASCIGACSEITCLPGTAARSKISANS